MRENKFKRETTNNSWTFIVHPGIPRYLTAHYKAAPRPLPAAAMLWFSQSSPRRWLPHWVPWRRMWAPNTWCCPLLQACPLLRWKQPCHTECGAFRSVYVFTSQLHAQGIANAVQAMSMKDGVMRTCWCSWHTLAPCNTVKKYNLTKRHHSE